MSETKHSCLIIRGKHPSCEHCSIFQHGYCDMFTEYLERKTYWLKAQFSGWHIDDVIALCVEQVQKQIHQFQGESAVSFFAWLRDIIYGTKATYIRTLNAKKNKNFVNFSEIDQIGDHTHHVEDDKKTSDVTYDSSEITSEDLENLDIINIILLEMKKNEPDSLKQRTVILTEILLEIIAKQKDPSGCCQLFLDFYEWSKQGYNQKEMAEKYYMASNSFNKRLSRCRKLVAPLLFLKLEQLKNETR